MKLYLSLNSWKLKRLTIMISTSKENLNIQPVDQQSFMSLMHPNSHAKGIVSAAGIFQDFNNAREPIPSDAIKKKKKPLFFQKKKKKCFFEEKKKYKNKNCFFFLHHYVPTPN